MQNILTVQNNLAVTIVPLGFSLDLSHCRCHPLEYLTGLSARVKTPLLQKHIADIAIKVY